MLTLAIDPLAVLVAAAAGYVIGFLWYSPRLFGPAWMRLTGITKRKVDAHKQEMGKSMTFAFVSTFLIALVLALLIENLGVSSVLSGALLAALVSFGFVATALVGEVLWERRPVGLFFLTAGQSIVAYVAMGAILAAW